MPEYVNLSIPKDMIQKIQKIIDENPELGYSSVADFIKNAIREYAYFRENDSPSSADAQ